MNYWVLRIALDAAIFYWGFRFGQWFSYPPSMEEMKRMMADSRELRELRESRRDSGE